MAQYVALLRGIAPMNPNMRNQKLREVFEGLGFTNVATVISSGNVLFESPRTDVAGLEARIEAAWPKKLGFISTTIVYSREQLQQLAEINPFKGYAHNQSTYLTVTFLKHPPRAKHALPFRGKEYQIIAMHGRAICSVANLGGTKTPNLMAWLERQYGKEITTRTWLTVERILQKFAA